MSSASTSFTSRLRNLRYKLDQKVNKGSYESLEKILQNEIKKLQISFENFISLANEFCPDFREKIFVKETDKCGQIAHFREQQNLVFPIEAKPLSVQHVCSLKHAAL